jgi:hypothetical protein
MRPTMLISSEGRRIDFTRSDPAADNTLFQLFFRWSEFVYTSITKICKPQVLSRSLQIRYTHLHSTVNFAFALKIETMPELENKVAEEKRF